MLKYLFSFSILLFKGCTLNTISPPNKTLNQETSHKENKSDIEEDDHQETSQKENKTDIEEDDHQDTANTNGSELELHIPEENIHEGESNCRIIKGKKDSYIVYDIKDNQVTLPCTENLCWQKMSKDYNGSKPLSFKEPNKCQTLFNKNLKKDYLSTGAGAVAGYMPEIEEKILKLRRRLGASGLPMPILIDDPLFLHIYSLFSMTSKFENEFKEQIIKGYKYLKADQKSKDQVIGIYDNRCDEKGESKCKCKTGKFPKKEAEKIIKENEKNCPILKNKLNDKPKWIKLLKFKKEPNKTDYLCFVAYNFDNLPQFVEKVQEQYNSYKNNSYKRKLLGSFLFPQMGFKTLDLSNIYMKNEVFDSNNGELSGFPIISWISDFLFQLDRKGVIAKAQTYVKPGMCFSPIKMVNIYECPIFCDADDISKETPCYVGIFHKNREGELIFDLGFQVGNLEGFGIKAKKI